MKKGCLRIATCQFAVSGDPGRNGRQIRKQIAQAAKQGADIVHFSETALSGYSGVDLPDLKGYDWEKLRRETEAVCDQARQSKIWVVLGSTHPLTGNNKPHNCLYLISPDGKIRDRYDKRFCTASDLNHYSPGDHFVTVTVNGVKCGLLICYDVRFPELIRAYYRLGIRVLFHSFHNARTKKAGYWRKVIRQTLQGHAGINHLFISANNSSARISQWPAVFICPDGIIARSLKSHCAGVMVNTADINKSYCDPSRPFRDAAIRGVLHSGQRVRDPRSKNKRCL